MAKLDSSLAKDLVRQEALRQGVDPDIAVAIFHAENGRAPVVDTTTTSPKGAVGILQVTPGTLKGLTEQGFVPPDNDYTSPIGQIRAGVAAIRELNSRGITKPVEVALGYNGSPAVLTSFRKGGAIPAESSNYIKNFGAAMEGSLDMTPSTPEPSNSGGTSYRESVSGRVIPTDVESGIRASQTRASTIADQLIAQVDDLVNQITGNTKAQTEALGRVGEAGAWTAQAKADIEVNKLRSQGDILDAFGINLNGTDAATRDGLVRNLQVLKQTQAERDPIAREITKLQGTNPLDDPAGWLINNFKAFGLAQKHNALAAQENRATENIANLQALASKQLAIQPEDLAESIKIRAFSEAQLARAQADVAISQTQGAAISSIARAAQERLNAANADFSHRIAVGRLLAEKYQYGLAESERNQLAKQEQDMLDSINGMLATVGGKPLNKLLYRAYSKDMQDRLNFVATSGRWGRSTGEAVTTLRGAIGDGGIRALMQENSPLASFLQDAVKGGQAELRALREKEDKTGIPARELKEAKTDDDRLQVGINLWQARMEEEKNRRDYSTLSEGNPYKVDYGVALLSPSLKGNSVNKFVEEFVKNARVGAKPDDGLIWSNAVATALTDPKQVAKLARDMSEYYRTATAEKTFTIGSSQFGLPPLKEYPVLRANNVVDMFSTAAIERQLTLEIVRGITQQVPFDALGNFQQPVQ